MYETILQFLVGVVNAPLETLGVAGILFHIQRGYILTRHILIPRYRYCRALRKNMQIVVDSFIQIDILHQEMKATGKNVDSLTESILRLNAEISLPLLKARRIVNDANAHLFIEKLYSKMAKYLKILCTQHEYILLHNKLQDNFLSPEELEIVVQNLLDTLPRTFWESSTIYFKRVNLNLKRPKSIDAKFIDGLFVLGQAKKMELSPIDDSLRYFIGEIKIAYLQKNEIRCKDLFSTLEQSLQRENYR